VTGVTRRFRTGLPVDLPRSLRPLVASAHDPTIRLRADVVVRAAHSPDGPGTVRIERGGDGSFAATAWGPGAGWLLDGAPALVGAEDDLDGFDPTHHPLVARAHHLRPGLRMVRSRSVQDVLAATIIAQRVTSDEAGRSWTRLVRRYGAPAPGPHELVLPPTAGELATLPLVALAELGVERNRARRLTTAHRHVRYLQGAVDGPLDSLEARLTRVPGVGVWTAAHLRRVAGGDPDAVEVGDDGVKHHICWNLAGTPRGSDERMLELLAPWEGHRGRVVRLLLSAGSRPPTFRGKPRTIAVDRLRPG
jgi:3-methyladenine DNA glycosylase/8-oxoguanine DNA glycosylase